MIISQEHLKNLLFNAYVDGVNSAVVPASEKLEITGVARAMTINNTAREYAVKVAAETNTTLTKKKK